MQDEINKIIEENIPKQLGEVLQKRFKELEELEKEHKNLRLLYDGVSDKFEKLTIENRSLRAELSEHNTLCTKLEEIKNKELRLETELLKKDKECSERISEMAVTLNLSLTKNLAYKSSIYEHSNGTNGEKDKYGNDIFKNINSTKTETRELD